MVIGVTPEMYKYVCVIKNTPPVQGTQESGSIVSIYPPHIKLSTFTLEQIFFSGSKVEGYFVFNILEGGEFLHCHNHTSTEKGLSVFVAASTHLIGVGSLLQMVVNDEIEAQTMAQEVGQCLDGFKEGASKLFYKASSFEFRLTTREHPYHDVTAMPLLKNISPSNFVQLFSALLAERSVLLVSSNPAILSASILSLLSFLYPLRWSSICYPVLPTRLSLILHSPIPYIIGCLPFTLIAAGDPPPRTLIVNLDNTTLITHEPIDPLPAPLTHTLLEGLRKHANLFLPREQTRPKDMLLPPSISTPEAVTAGEKQGFWAGVMESKLAMEKRWPWAESVLDNPIILESLEDAETLVPLENGTSVPLDTPSLRAHFTAVVAALIEPFPLLVSTANSPSTPLDTDAFAMELPESYFTFAKPVLQTNMMEKFLSEYLTSSATTSRTEFAKVIDFIYASRHTEISTRETKPLLEGYLWKRGRNMKNWRYRFFQLQDTDLKYFEDKHRKAPIENGDDVKSPSLTTRGTILLSAASEANICIPPVPEDKKKEFATPYPFSITVIKPSKKIRTLQMCAHSNDERRVWVKLLRTIAIAHATALPSSHPRTSQPATLPPAYPPPSDAARTATVAVLRENRQALDEKIQKAVEGAIKSRPFSSNVNYLEVPCM